MKTLFRRELRRQTPGAAALLATGILLAFGLCTQSGSSILERLDYLGVCLVIVASACPFLLGLNTTAPDAESGGLAFLGRMPLPRGRELATRVAAAGVLSVATIAVAGLLSGAVVLLVQLDAVAPSAAEPGLGALVNPSYLVVLPLGAFAAGVAASATIGRTLHALVGAPLVAGAALITGASVSAGLGIWGFELPRSLESFVECGAGIGVLFAIALAAHARGDVHRRSLRPLAAGGLTFALVTALLGGVTFTASGGVRVYTIVTRERARYRPFRDPRSGRTLEVETLPAAYPLPGELGVRVLERAGTPGAFLPLPTDLQLLGFTPDGSGIVAGRYDPAHKLVVIDPATGELHVFREPFRFADGWHPIWEGDETGLSFNVRKRDGREGAGSVVWRGRTPLFVQTHARPSNNLVESAVFDPEGDGTPTLLGGVARSFGGARILVTRPDGAFAVVDVAPDSHPLAGPSPALERRRGEHSFETRTLELPAGFHPLAGRLVHSGTVALILGERSVSPDARLELVRVKLDDAAAAPLAISLPPSAGATVQGVTVDVSPGAERLAVWLTTASGRTPPRRGEGTAEGPIDFIDARTGALVLRVPMYAHYARLTWSDDDRRAAVAGWDGNGQPAASWFDLEPGAPIHDVAGSLLGGGMPQFEAFAEPHRLLLAWPPGLALDLETGKVVPTEGERGR